MKSTVKATAIAAILCGTIIVFGCGIIPKTVNIPVVNQTGVTITHVYIRDAGTANWGTLLNQSIRTRTVQKTSYDNKGRAYTYNTYEYVKDQYGNNIYDIQNLANGYPYNYRFNAPRTSDGETPQLKSIDIKFVDVNGFAYGKSNVNLTNVERIIIAQSDIYPILTMQNNTGFPINITNPITKAIGNGASAAYQMPELTNDRRHIVSYSINDYRFDKEVMLNNSTTLALTDRPPTITVQNNTGFPITITSPFSQTVADGSSSNRHPKNSKNNPKHIISYNSGTFRYNKEVTLNEEDVILTLGENDRPPIVILENHTGNTINMAFIRNAGTEWGNSLTSEGTSADVRVGSFTNKESKKIWLGFINGLSPDKYDFRLDDIQNNSYVKLHKEIIKDTTLTFTPKDKP